MRRLRAVAYLDRTILAVRDAETRRRGRGRRPAVEIFWLRTSISPMGTKTAPTTLSAVVLVTEV